MDELAPARPTSTLALPGFILDEIVAHARADCPAEACGIIAGPGRIATTLCRGRNISPTPDVAYEIDAETLARQIDFEDAGLALLAIYHSHPRGPDIPSPADIQRALYPDCVTIICSLADPGCPVVRGFRIMAGAVHEVEIVALG